MRTGSQLGLLLHNCVFSSFCLHLLAGLWKHTFPVFKTFSVKQRQGNEWGPFPQRGPGDVKVYFINDNTGGVNGNNFLLPFNFAGLSR